MDRMLHYLALLKDYAKDYLLENTGLKVLALLITAVLWLSVASRPVSQITLRDVPIVMPLPSYPELTVSAVDTLTARVYLRGPRDVLDTIRSTEVSAIADMSKVEPGVRVIPITLDESRLPSSVKAEGVEPRSIRVTVEPVVEREVPVVPRLDGQPPEGYQVLDKQITPSSIRVVGAASQVRDVKEVSTETVSLAGRTGSFNELVAIDTGSPSVTISSKDEREALLTVNIGEVQKERLIDRVPIRLGGGPPSAQIIPQFVRVTITGARSAVDAIKPADITASVEYYPGIEKARDVVPKVEVSLEYSDKVTVRSVEPKTIRIR
jgi:YbbR domain-containing protein